MMQPLPERAFNSALQLIRSSFAATIEYNYPSLSRFGGHYANALPSKMKGWLTIKAFRDLRSFAAAVKVDVT
jgi:hypothetical protein